MQTMCIDMGHVLRKENYVLRKVLPLKLKVKKKETCQDLERQERKFKGGGKFNKRQVKTI